MSRVDMIDINCEIKKLIDYAVDRGLISERDKTYCINKLLETLKLDCYTQPIEHMCGESNIEDILDNINQWALENNLIKDYDMDSLDWFDTYVISQLIHMPSVIEEKFYEEYKKSPQHATKYYYDFARNSNYIREKRIAKDIKWTYPTEYGTLDLTINLSKPEKDPKKIANAEKHESSSYPKCLLCVENEGYEGGEKHVPRGNHRVISLQLAGEQWYMQYSPYVYYNEHCILVKEEHEPMEISKVTFKRLIDFVNAFPHYFIGSNAGLPIVGGSILGHNHYQGGRYSFAIEKAKEMCCIELKHNINAFILKWPMSVIRLKGRDKDSLINTAYEVYLKRQNYSDPSVDIYSHTNNTPHNTVTPIARCREGVYEIDLVLRNNKTTKEKPYGLYHVREEYHNIKKENIGLIEVMGLAVLPARLDRELGLLKDFLLRKDLEGIAKHKDLNKHSKWAREILDRNELSRENITEVIRNEVGRVFLEALKDASVFKEDESGKLAFKKCRDELFSNLRP